MFWTFLWLPESNDRAVLCTCQALFSAFGVGEKMYPTSIANLEIPLHHNLLNFSHVLSHTSRHFVTMLHFSHQSLESLYIESFFSPAININFRFGGKAGVQGAWIRGKHGVPGSVGNKHHRPRHPAPRLFHRIHIFRETTKKLGGLQRYGGR